MQEELPQVPIQQPKLMKKKTKRIIFIISDIIAIIGFLIYCGFIQSYLSTIYLFLLLMLINYTYIKIIKGVRYEDRLVSLDEFQQIQNNLEEQSFDRLSFWVEAYDVKKFIWITIIVFSSLTLLFKIIILPILYHVENAVDIMNIWNFQGLEIYYQVPMTGSDYIDMFIPNTLILIYSSLILKFREFDQKTQLYSFNQSTKQTKVIILFMQIFLILLISITRSIIGYILWIYLVVLLVKLYKDQLIEKYYILTLKFTIVLIIVAMFFASTPVINFGNFKDTELINILGLELLINYAQHRIEAITFILVSIIIFNMLCVLQEQINNAIFRRKFQKAIDLALQIKELLKSNIDIENQPLHKSYEQLEQSKLHDSIEQEEKIENQQIIEESEIQENQQSYEELDQQDKQQLEDDQQEQLVKSKTISDKIDDYIIIIKKYVDNPYVTIRVLQILTIVIIIEQKTYFSLGLVLWMIMLGFTQNLKHISVITLLVLPFISLNFGTFYYENIVSMNSNYSSCNSNIRTDVSQPPTSVCEKLGLYQAHLSYINSTIMNITLSLYVLLLRQIKDYVEDNSKINITWGNIVIAILFRISFILSIIILYIVGFNQINVVQLVLVLILLIFLINQSTRCQYQGRTVSFVYKYWGVLLFYVSILMLGRYLTMMFWKPPNKDDTQDIVALQILGISNNNTNEILFWILFYSAQLQYQSFNSKIYIQFQNSIMYLINKKLGDKLPVVSVNILKLLLMRFLIWTAYIINLCDMFYSPYSYINTILLLYVGISFLYYVSKIMTSINYDTIYKIWYVYLNLLIITFLLRYCFQFICISSFSDINSQTLIQFYTNLQYFYQDYGFYGYKDSQLKIEFFPDMVNILFGSFALHSFNQFRKASMIQHDEYANQLSETDLHQTKQLQQVMSISILKQWLWLKKPILLIAHLNTDILTVFVVASCVFYLRSIAALILLIVYLSYFLIVHNQLLNKLAENQILKTMQIQIKNLKDRYLLFKNVDEFSENQIKIMVEQLQLLRLTTRIRMKRIIWMISFYFTAFCIFLTYLSQFLTTESVIDLGSSSTHWVQKLATIFFVSGTFSQQITVTDICFCGVNPSDTNCSTNNIPYTISNIWRQSWFYLVLLLANVVDTACTRILSEDLEEQRQKLEDEKLNQKEEILEIDFTMEVMEEFTKNYPHVKFIDNVEQKVSDLDRESLIINFYRNKTRILNLTFQEAFFRFVQRVLTLILLSNTILVNTLFSLVYLAVSTLLFQMKASLLNVKILNTFSIFAIWFQYSLYLMDWQPLQKNIPKITGLQSSDFSIMTMLNVTNPYQLSYFGFRNGELLDCDELDESNNLFQNETCETNQLLNWVFIFNLLVISLIYVYFLLLEWLAEQIYKSSAEMKHDSLLTKSCLRNQIVIIDFQKWKTRSFTFKQTLLQIFIRNSHMVLIALILILSQTNRTIFNLFEMVLAIIFVYITEFHFQWPYLYTKKQFILDMFKALYYIPVIAIAAFTLLKAPFILKVCKNQTIYYIKGDPIVSADESLIFYCVEVFNIRITGMVFIMFFISLYFELVASQEYQKQILTFQIKEQLRARLVQKALSYQQTQQKYIEILKQQKQKNIFKQISQQIEVKLRKWQQKFKSQANKAEKEAVEEQNIQIVQSLYPESIDFREQQREEQRQQEENFNNLKSFQKFCINSILFVRKYNHTIKFMSLQQLLDQILQQNQLLKRYVVFTIEKHLTDSLKIYQFELDLIDRFYEDAKKLFVKQKCQLSEQQIQTLLNTIIRRRSASNQFEDSIDDKPEFDGNFVTIKDIKNKIIIQNTKLEITQNSLTCLSTSQLIGYLLIELLKLLIARWQSFTCILIIFYYAKNSALLGLILPLTLFSWFIIDENSKYFWALSYSIYSSILILIFLSTLYGINYNYPDQPFDNDNLPWYYPLDNAGNNGLFFEIFIMWLIQFEVFLMKQFGVYYKRLTQIENTFQGYMRLKINKFNNNEVNQNAQEEEQLEILDIPEQQMNSLEKKIMKNPQLLNDNYQTKFFDRIFSFEFSRPGYDLYTYIVTVQLLLFLYMLFFFNFMINAEVDLTQYIKYNQIPGSLVLALTCHIFLMVWERYLVLLDDKRDLQITKGQKKKFFEIYKSQFVLKFITQIIVLILVFWFVYINLGKPWSDSTQDNGIDNQYISNGYIICFFLLYCCYFYLSALQLKYGYAELKIRNSFLYTYTNMNNMFVQTFYAIPFLFELKVLMDWTFLDTALDIWQWFRLEDIHGLLFFSKIQSKTYMDRKIGLKIGAFAKCGMGCTLVFVILLCIIGPLILFSSLNPSTEINLVNGGGLEISLVNVKTNLNIQLFSTLQLLGLEKGPLGSKSEVKEYIQPSLTNPILLNAPKTGSIQRFQIISFSDVNWALSQPLYNEIVKELKTTLDDVDEGQFMINVTYYMQRQIEQSLPQENTFSYPYNPSLMGYSGHETTYLNRQILQQIYDSIVSCAQIPINLTNFYIETLQLYSTDGVVFKPRPIIGNGVNSNMDVQMSLQCAPGLQKPIDGSSWWNFTYIGSSQQILPLYSGINGMLFFVVSDKYSSFTSGFSIITIYTSVILLIGSFIRSTFSGKVWMIEYNEAMLPDDILMLCESIAIARSNQDYKKENMLYYELIDILRSPEITKVMTGSWSETFREIEKKQKQD